VALTLRGFIDLPPHAQGGFDHGDVHLQSGRVFVAHTATGTVEVIDGQESRHLATINGCPEGSGVLCAQDEGLVFAAARGAGKVLVIETRSGIVVREFMVGPRPNGLAWDSGRKSLLVADVEDLTGRLIDPATGTLLQLIQLPGRPRWAAYHAELDRFLVNIRDPAAVLVLAGKDGARMEAWPVSSDGPHGLDIDTAAGRVFVACDGGMVVAHDLATGREIARTPISGEPDVVWYNAGRNRLYVAIGKPGLIEVIDTRLLTPIEKVTTEEGAHTMAFDHTRQRLYVFLPRSCRAAVYEEV
jgi:DNA-binding beta-propeller fold protein YncE